MTWFWQTLITVHGILLGLFVVSTAVLLVVSCLNRLRVRNVLFSWGRGRLMGLPLIPTLFLAVVVGVFAYVAFTGQTGPVLTPLLLSGYLIGGLFWYLSSVLGETVVVTEFGLVHDVRRLTTSIPWTRIVDYAEVPARGSGHYALFYVDSAHQRLRIDVRVPRVLRERFRVLVRARLDARFDYVMNTPHGTRELQP